MKSSMNNKGMTLIELTIVFSVIGILVTALYFQFENWVTGYKIESQTKEMYIDLLNTRAKSMQRNRMHFLDLSVNRYDIYEDDDPAPNGDGIANPAIDTEISKRILEPRYPITWNDASTRIEFDSKGLSSDKLICTNAAADELERADYNCILISTTRINMGKLDDSGGACDSNNCTAR